MADPTREQFESAAQQVMKTAPKGLSRDQFFAMIDKVIQDTPDKPGQGELAPHDQFGRPTHEPDTFMGGATKSLMSEVLAGGKDNPLRHAAYPQNIGDLAGLLLPGGASGTLKGLRSTTAPTIPATIEEVAAPVGKAAIRGLKATSRGAATVLEEVPSVRKAVPLAERVTQGLRKFGEPDPPEWLDRHMPNVGADSSAVEATTSHVPYASPSHVPEPSMAARMGGKAPTLEDELQKALEGIRKPEDPRITSMAPEQGITPGAPIKQSGKFGKADALGKPGGYSSGNPGTTPEQSGLKSVEAQGVHTDALAEQEHQRLLDKFGGRGEDVAAPGAEAPSAMPEPSSAPAPEALPQTDVEKPHVGWKEALDNLQTRVGARDAARAVGGKQAGYTPEDIRGITGKRGQLPQEAQDRILEDMLRKAMERDQP